MIPILGLVVVISIDQMRADYVERFSPHFTSRGFKRFTAMERRRPGGWPGGVPPPPLAAETAPGQPAGTPAFRLRWANAETAPGHASIGTGLLPSEHGVIGNRWFERDAPVDEARWAWYFDDVTPYRRDGVSYPPVPREQQWWRQGGSPQSATAVIPPTKFKGRVVSVAHKETTARLMGGSGAHAVYWFDTALPGWRSVGSQPAPGEQPRGPHYTSFNALVPGYLPGSQQWRPLPGDLADVTFDPPAAWPLKNTRYGGTFPHPVPDARGLTYSPFGHELLFDFALHVLVTDEPDVFFVSVSSTDNLGHYYGPDSMEVADSMIRLDRALAHFLDALERRAGENLTVLLTSDHGIQPTPEIAKLRNPRADAGRLDLRNPDPNATSMRDLPPLRLELERRLARRLGLPFDERAPLRNALIYFFEGTGLYLNHRRIADAARAKRELRDILRSIDGVAGAWTNDDDLPPLIRNSFHRDRSGDVLIALKPGWIWHWGSNSTTHGQPVDDDLRVPLLLWGKEPPAILPPLSPAPSPRAAGRGMG